jgi:hypothetical protein
VLVAEDEAQGNFARGFLSFFDNPAARILIRSAPKGIGDAKQYVMQTAPIECDLLARSSVSAKLVVLIDADDLGAEARRTAVQEACKGRADAVVVPDPEIEQWISWILEAKEPSTVRRKADLARLAYRAGKQLAAACQRDAEIPTAIAQFCPEIRRLIGFLKDS